VVLKRDNIKPCAKHITKTKKEHMKLVIALLGWFLFVWKLPDFAPTLLWNYCQSPHEECVILTPANEILQPKPEEQPLIISMKVTGYCPCAICCGMYADGKTSRNDDAYVCDGVAADPNLIPYRTKLFIPNVGIREVDDTGSAMQKSAREGIYHIDLRFKTHSEARAWGVRELPITFIEKTL
jgi:3D (Asp-Asp-Asp) domain-containing protein